MDDEYLQNIGLFYDEKIKFLSDKDKFLKCNGCENNKVFKETNDKLSFTCGTNLKGNCGIQIEIILPKYLHYEKELTSLRTKVNEGINWNTLGKYLDVEKEIKEQEKKENEGNTAIKYIEELFIDINLKHKQELLQTFYDNRIQYTRKCKVIKKKLISDIQKDTKKQLRNEYISIVTDMNKEYTEIKEIIDDINPYLQTDKPIVKIHLSSTIIDYKIRQIH